MSTTKPHPNATMRVWVAPDGSIHVRNVGGGLVKWAGPRGDVHPDDLKLWKGVTADGR